MTIAWSQCITFYQTKCTNVQNQDQCGDRILLAVTSIHRSQGVNSRLEEMQHKVFGNVCHVLSFGAEMYQQITDRERVGLLAVGF